MLNEARPRIDSRVLILPHERLRKEDVVEQLLVRVDIQCVVKFRAPSKIVLEIEKTVVQKAARKEI